MNKVTEQILAHTSVRKFSQDSIDEKTVETVVRCAQMASTSSHFQAYTIIRVCDQDKKDFLAEAAGGQNWVKTAPLVLLFCADLRRAADYFEGVSEETVSNTEFYTVSVIDAALAAQNAFIAAESMGLGGVIVGGIRNDVAGVSEVFDLPDLVAPLFLLCLGYPGQQPDLKPRLPIGEILKRDYYDTSSTEENIKGYDLEMKEYYSRRTGGKADYTWTQHCGRMLAAKTRDEVGAFFREKGFLNK